MDSGIAQWLGCVAQELGLSLSHVECPMNSSHFSELLQFHQASGLEGSLNRAAKCPSRTKMCKQATCAEAAKLSTISQSACQWRWRSRAKDTASSPMVSGCGNNLNLYLADLSENHMIRRQLYSDDRLVLKQTTIAISEGFRPKHSRSCSWKSAWLWYRIVWYLFPKL